MTTHSTLRAALVLAVLTACTHPMQIHGPRVRPGQHSGVVVPIPTKAISAPDGRARETVRVPPLGAYMTWGGRFEDYDAWRPGWLLGVHLNPFDVIPRGTAYLELTNPTWPVALGGGVTLGHNIGQLYVMSGVVKGPASIFAVARATSHSEPRETIDGTRRPLTRTSALGGGFEIPIVRSITFRAVGELTQGRRNIPGNGSEIRQWVVTAALGWRD